jgi:uncharacterized membrane protein (Fun14 family)
MVELDPLSLGLEVGGGGILGFLTGYAAKKVVKIVAILIGAQLALFKFLETRGVLEVNWDALYTGAANTTRAAANATMGGGNASGNATNATGNATAETAGAGGGLFESLLSVLPVGGGFTAGALIGFKKG